MASESRTNHNQQHKKGECESFESSTHHVPPPGSHNYPAGYPLSYPSSMGYPPPPPPEQYPGYPPPSYYPNYAQAPPAAYYNATVPRQQQGHQRSLTFFHCFITMVKSVMLFGITSFFFTWIALLPQFPVFHVDNFSVSNFNATLPSFTANWKADLTVDNPNTKVKIEFGQLYNYVIYDEDYCLASAIARPFSLETNKSNVIHAKLSANNKDNLVENWVVEKLAKERSNGTVSFNFKMVFSTTFKSEVWWNTHSTLEVLCEDIPVAFVGASGYGNSNITANGNRDCLVFSSE